MAKDFTTISQPLPRGLRNNNPGNLRPPGKRQMFVGTVGTSGGFVVFKNIAYGIRGMAKNAITHIVKRGNDTPAKYVSAYAPASDGNDTAKYIKLVSEKLGIKPNDRIELTGENLRKLIRIHLVTEIGAKYSALISDGEINEGLSKLREG